LKDDSKLDVWSHIETIHPRNRLVLLGASNLTRAFSMVVRFARKRIQGPLFIHAAMGLGRSYGQESRFLEKKSLGIFLCGIWDALEQEKKIPTTAIVTDIGNDLAYEVPVKTVVEWVEACLDRLELVGANIVLSDLPMSTLREVGAVRYRIFRTVLFPYCRLSWKEMLNRAEQLSERLHEISKTRNMPIFIGKKEWHGLDPIHPRRSALRQQWQELFALAGVELKEKSNSENHFLLTRYLRNLRPESWSQFSITRHSKQPCGRLHDGTTIELY
jgi:hypothetical protein